MTPRLLTTLPFAFAALALVACEDGVPTGLPGQLTGSAGQVTLASFDGIWAGNYVGNPPGTADQWDSSFLGYMRDGRLMMYESNGQVWDGDYEMTTAARANSPDVVVFRPDGRRATRLAIDASVSGDNSLDISYNLGTAVGLIQMQFLRDTSYERNSSLAQLDGNWTLVPDTEEIANERDPRPALTLAIVNEGGRAVFNDQDANGCFYSGVIELIDSSRNLYEISEFSLTDATPGGGECDVIIEVTNTDDQGTVSRDPTPFPFAGDAYTGFATLPTANRLTLVLSNTDDRGFALELARN